MLIRSFSDDQSLDIDDLKDIGILNHKRTIYVFVKENEFKAKLCRSAKFAIVNECVYYGDHRGNVVSIKIPNSTINRTAVYFGTLCYEIPSDIRTAYFTIDIGLNKERQTLHDLNEVQNRSESAISSKLMGADPDIIDEYQDGLSTCIIPPNYYTELQMINAIGDFGTIMHDMDVGQIQYKELIDNSTKFIYCNINTWDSMKAEFIHKANECNFGSEITALDISEKIGNSFVNNLHENAIFIYDSDAKGLNKPGVNVTGGIITNGKYYPENYLIKNKASIANLFSSACKDIESQYGHIRVMCCPSNLGNTTKILYKDWINNSPVIPLRKDGEGNDVSSIDKGFSIDNNISEYISCMENPNFY